MRFPRPTLAAVPAVVALLAPPGRLAAQSPAATVAGVVRDSLGGGVLAGATVQLVAADDPARFARTVVADSAGRYAVADVPAGSYVVGFLHPVVDSLGIEPAARTVAVGRTGTVTADLATPSPARVRAAICRAPGANAASAPAGDAGAVLVGVVRQAANGAPAAGASVAGEWMDYTLGRGGVAQHPRRIVATTGADGWFALCNVPSGGIVAVQAGLGADSTARIELQVPESGFLHRILHVGASRTVAAAPRSVQAGDGRLTGTVRAADGGRALEGAVVRLAGGPETRTNAAGEWVLGDAPAGTRMLEVRAVGFYPERRAVDVVPDAAPVPVRLSSFQAVLDTVRIRANRGDRVMTEFLQRQRSNGSGRFLTEQDIARRNATVATDIFRNFAGLRVDGHGPDASLTMRGGMSGFATGEDDRCSPDVYIDGSYINASAADIDMWVQPNRIRAIEVYAGAVVPPQFRRGMQTCGSIVIWTKAPADPVR